MPRCPRCRSACSPAGQDICLDPTLAEYQRLRAAGRTPRLVVGPWTHASAFNDDLPVVVGEALDWLTAYCSHDPAGWTEAPGTGARRRWPPGMARPAGLAAAAGRRPDLAAGRGRHARTSQAAGAGVSSLRYDPADPTPSVGGQLVSDRAGARDNRPWRPGPTFWSSPARRCPPIIEVIGPVSARLRVRASGPHFDVFARLCDVDPRGRSRNVCDGLIRHDPGAPAEPGPSPAVRRSPCR